MAERVEYGNYDKGEAAPDAQPAVGLLRRRRVRCSIGKGYLNVNRKYNNINKNLNKYLKC